MYAINTLRREFGDNYVTEFPDGTIVPWKLLSIGDFLKYQIQFKSNVQIPAEIENEIFQKCVLDKAQVKTFLQLKAGIVSTVATLIMNHSGPSNPDELNYTLSLGRTVAQQSIHKIVSIITQAFPGYIPEQLYDMEYEVLILRLAQAEDKLLTLGILNEPISFGVIDDKTQPPLKKEKTKKIDLKKQYEQQKIIKTAVSQPPTKSVKQTIITKHDILEHDASGLGHEQLDNSIEKKKMIDDTAKFYKDYIEQLQNKQQLKFKTDEERIAEAKIRSAKTQAKLNELEKKKAIEEKEEFKKLIQVRERERKRQARRKRK